MSPKLQIKRLEKQLDDLLPQSQLATTIASITGFGLVCATELAAEILGAQYIIEPIHTPRMATFPHKIK